jgi:H+/Na+-translocating ferredoxin:NAD+ oxidoreductase subunit G
MICKFKWWVGAALLLSPGWAAAQGVYFSTEQVLKDFFATSERVSYERVPVDAGLEARLGYRPAKDRYVVFVAHTGNRIDGYAVIDEERGEHLPITFAVKLGPDGAVQRTEVMVYREGYGEEIRAEQFRRQFVGKGSAAPLRFGEDVAAISGATISSRSMAITVKRAVELVRQLQARSGTTADAAVPASEHTEL